MTPKVTVILCGYNQAPHVTGAVESVLTQTYPHLELLVIDNGSTDDSQARLRPWAADPRVRLFLHPTNGPVTHRLNEAVSHATGDFISILYADDYYLPHKLERQVAAFAALPPDYGVVYSPGLRLNETTGAQWRDRTLTRSGDVLREMFVHHNSEGFINPISPLIRRECFLRCPFHEDVFTEGETIFLRFAVYYKFHFLDEPLSVMREHTFNLGKSIRVNIEVALVLLDKLAKEPGFPDALRPDLVAFRGNLLGVWGWLALRMAADPGWARQCFLAAIRLQPWQALRPRTVGGLVLSLLPAWAVRQVNRLINALRPHKETIAVRTGYT